MNRSASWFFRRAFIGILMLDALLILCSFFLQRQRRSRVAASEQNCIIMIIALYIVITIINAGSSLLFLFCSALYIRLWFFLPSFAACRVLLCVICLLLLEEAILPVAKATRSWWVCCGKPLLVYVQREIHLVFDICKLMSSVSCYDEQVLYKWDTSGVMQISDRRV